jgi:hypothetical protein
MAKERKCQYCKEKVAKDRYYLIFCLEVETETQVHYIGLNKVVEDLSAWLVGKPIHLSATQLMLFRPDITKAFLTTLANGERVLAYTFKPYIICNKCYEEYMKIIPLL